MRICSNLFLILICVNIVLFYIIIILKITNIHCSRKWAKDIFSTLITFAENYVTKKKKIVKIQTFEITYYGVIEEFENSKMIKLLSISFIHLKVLYFLQFMIVRKILQIFLSKNRGLKIFSSFHYIICLFKS